jgi:AcrR family transcriptional regulator
MTAGTPAGRPKKGNLRNALVDAGIELLRARGADGLSLRECAAMAGVSHAAPAYHFNNLAGLATAIAARGFRLFGDAMTARLDTAPGTPGGRLKAICHGYLDFAAGHPELFLFIFSGQRFEKDEEFSQHATRAYVLLRETCAPFVRPGTNPEEVEIFVWSLVHGYAHLAMTRRDDSPELSGNWPELAPLLDYLEKALSPPAG